MENATPKRRKKARRKITKVAPAPTVAVNARFPVEHWEKLQWVAIANGTKRADELRRAVATHVAHARPPQSGDTAVINGFCGRRKDAWLALAAEYETTIGELLADTLDSLCRKRFGTAPILRNGEWHWAGPEAAEVAENSRAAFESMSGKPGEK